MVPQPYRAFGSLFFLLHRRGGKVLTITLTGDTFIA
jgi:hypothetical protein